LRIAWALKQYWSWRGLVPEGLAWLNRLLPIAETWGVTGARARALTLNAFLLRMQWNIPIALPCADQAVEIARSAGELRDLGFALQEAGYLHQFPIPPHCALAVEYLEESRKSFEMLGDDSMREWTDTIQGMAIAGTGDVARGMAQMQASLEQCRASGDKLGMLDAAGGLGYITLIIGDYASAARYNGEAVALGRELRIAIEFVQMLTLFTACVIKLGDYRQGLPRAEEVMRLYHDQASIPGIVIGLEMIGMCLAASKKFESAVRLFGNVEREREAKRSTTFVVPDFFAPEWANVRAQMGDAAYEQANAEGRAMELERAYDYALEQVKNL
jgi:tetratricopeptide (TPR) repeat protein